MNKTDREGMINLMMEFLRDEYKIIEEMDQEV